MSCGGHEAEYSENQIMGVWKRGMKCPVGPWFVGCIMVKVVWLAVYLVSNLHAVGTHHT